MGMSIDEAIKQLTTYSIPCGKYKNAYDLAIDTMHKYQKIEKILNDWENSGEEDDPINIIDNIEELVEDGNDDY